METRQTLEAHVGRKMSEFRRITEDRVTEHELQCTFERVWGKVTDYYNPLPVSLDIFLWF